jgi:transposase
LTPDQVAFLLGGETLKKWAGFTLKERTILFHKKYKMKWISVTALRRLYLKNNVKIKIVRQEKRMPLNSWKKFGDNVRRLRKEI